MKQYDSYKDSGVEWIGKIPSHWEMTKLKYLTSCNDEVLPDNTPNDYIIQYVEIGDVSSVEGIKNITEYEFKSAPSRARRITRIGDVIVSTVRTYLKAISKIEKEGLVVSTGFAVLRPYNIYENYLGYAVLSEKFMNEVVSKSEGVSYPAINSTALINIKVPLPTFEEQILISKFLQDKCGKIDKAIATQEKRVELLKELRQNIITQAVTRGINPNAPLKDSGVEWIGKVPGHWENAPIKYTVKSPYNSFIDGDWIESKVIVSDGIRYLTTGNVGALKYKEQGNGFISESTFKELNCSEVFPGDILISRLNEPIGRACIVPDLGYRIVVAVDNVIYRPDTKLYDKKFLVYQMNCKPYADMANFIARGSTMSRVSRTTLGHFKLVVPPFSEQQEIVSYIEAKTARLDKSIEKAEHQIELLQELKQSIITEVVTGKRKVC